MVCGTLWRFTTNDLAILTFLANGGKIYLHTNVCIYKYQRLIHNYRERMVHILWIALPITSWIYEPSRNCTTSLSEKWLSYTILDINPMIFWQVSVITQTFNLIKVSVVTYPWESNFWHLKLVLKAHLANPTSQEAPYPLTLSLSAHKTFLYTNLPKPDT